MTGNASVSIAKSAAVSPSSDQNAVKVGDTIHYSYNVTNTGNITLTSVAVNDPSAGNVTCPIPAGAGLAPGASETCTADNPYTVVQSDVDAGGVTDSATATGFDTQGAQSEPSAASAITMPAVAAAPSVSLTKTATVDPARDQSAVKVGDRISYAYQVTNTGNVTLVSVAVSDPSAGNVTCPTPAAPGLAPGGAETCTADDPHPVTQVDVDNGGVTDTATATGIDTHGIQSPTSSQATVKVPATPAVPAVSLQKFANAANGDTSPITTGEQIQYSYLVENTGNVDLTTLTVSDNKVGSVSCPTPASPGLAPGDFETCTGTYTATAHRCGRQQRHQHGDRDRQRRRRRQRHLGAGHDFDSGNEPRAVGRDPQVGVGHALLRRRTASSSATTSPTATSSPTRATSTSRRSQSTIPQPAA